MSGFSCFSSSEHAGYRFGFQGQEKDDEVKGNGNHIDFGARGYDPRTGRWLSVDPLSKKYLDLSPYQFAGNSPILFLDPDGERIVNPNEKEAQAITDDLNRIYKSKYGVESAFSVQKRVRYVMVRTNDWHVSEPSSWLNALQKPEYKKVEVVDYEVSKNKDANFDWETDKYTKQMSDIMESKSDVTVDIVGDKGEEYYSQVSLTSDKGMLEDYGGGLTASKNKVLLSDKLTTSTDQNKKSQWTLGGVTLHELLYHIHNGGKSEGSPNKMRDFYNIRTGKDHPPGNKQNPLPK